MSTIDFRRLAELADDGLVVTDGAGAFLFCTHRFARLTGRSPSQIVGHSYRDFVHPDDTDATGEEVEGLRDGIPTFSFRNRWRHVDGSWVSLVWVAYSDKRNGLLYAAAREDAEDFDAEAEEL